MSAVDTTIGARPQGAAVPYRGSRVPGVTDVQSAIDAAYALLNSLQNVDLLVKTATSLLSSERVVTDATAITFDWSTAGVVKPILGQFTGDVTNASTDSLALTIGANKVTNAKLRQGAGLSVVGVTGNATANVADIVGTANQFLGVNSAGTALAFETMSGDATLASGVITLGANVVTAAKFRQSAGLSVVGNGGTSTANVSDITGTANQFLGVNSAGTALAFETMSGDATLASGVITLAANVVTAAKFRQSAGLSVVGNGGSSTANVSDITGTANQFLGVNAAGTALAFETMSGDATLSSGVITLAANVVSNGKFRQSAALSVVGNGGSSTANVADIAGTANQVLRINGAGNALGFGAIDLSQAAAATGVLQAACHPALTGAVTSASGALATSSTVDIVIVIGDGTNVITTGAAGNWTSQLDFAATIVQWSIVAKQSGSISIDVWKCTYSQFDAGATHPVAADKISATAPITFSSATKGQSSTLTGWTTAISAGDVLAFNVSSVTTCTQVVINLKVTKTS